MRPFDPTLVRAVPETRRPLAALGSLGALSGAFAIAQAFAVAQLVVAVVDGRPLLSPALVVLGVLGARGILSAATELTAAWTGSRIAGAVRHARISSWLDTPVDRRPDPATMITLSTQGASSIEPYVARYLPALVTAAVVPPLALLALAVTDIWSALIVLATVPLLPVFAALIGKHTEQETKQRWAESASLAGHFLDVVRGLPTLVGYQRASSQVVMVGAVNERHRRATMRTLRTAFLSSAALELLATISVAIVAVAVGLRLAHGGMALGTALTAILLAPEAYWPIRRVGQEFHAAADGAEALEALIPTPRTQPPSPLVEPGEPPRASPNRNQVRDAPSRGAASHVAVRALTYRYPGTDADVIRALDLDFEPGLTAITGPSGCGKTTLLELLAGLREPTSGTVDAPRAHLVTQRPFIAPTTLAANLTLSGSAPLTGMAPRGSVEVPATLRGMPSGVLGDDGFGLSAGQRARLAVERARRSDADLILLDEPTAHLDLESSELLLAQLRELARERIVVVVTHDPDLAAAADRTITLAPTGTTGMSGHLVSIRGSLRSPDSTSVGASSPDSTSVGSGSTSVGAGVWRAGVVGGLAATCGVALTATSGWLIVQASTQPVVLTLLTAIVCVRAFGLGRPVLRYVERLLSHDAALHELGRRRTSAYRALIPLTPARLGRRRRADLLTGFVRDLDDEVDIQVRTVVPLIGTAVASAVALVVTTAIHLQAGVVVGLALTAAAALAFIDWRAERDGQRDSLAARGSVGRAAHLATANALELQAISATDYALDQLESAERSARTSAVRQATGRALGVGGSLLVTGAATVAMAAVVADALRDGAISTPVAALLLLTPLALGEVLGALPDAMGALARGQAARQRIRTLLDQEPAVADSAERPTQPSTGTPQGWSPRGPGVPLGGTIELDRVSAEWTPGRTALQPTDLSVMPGDHVAITGPNGSGKSTLLAVLARHLDPRSGTYALDNRDVHGESLHAVRRHLALVDDEPHIFAGTLRANLLLAQPDAADRDVSRALVDAGLGHWLAALPEGLDSHLGAGRRGVSGGERARLGIARALLSRRPIVLLDEPVAHLDQPTARAVLDDLHTALHDRTVLVVTHQRIALERCGTVITWDEQVPAATRSTG